MTPSLWKTESLPRRQFGVSLVCSVVGLCLLVIGFRYREGPGMSSGLAGSLLGLLILAISAASLLWNGKQVVTVDPRARRIMLEEISRFGRKTRSVSFSEIAEFQLGELGDREGGSIFYHVVARLKNGSNLALFLGFFEGTANKAMMEARRQRLQHYLESTPELVEANRVRPVWPGSE